MSFWIWMTGGNNMPQNHTWGQRFALWCGKRLALRHGHVDIGEGCRISPEARINPRQGRIVLGPGCTIAPGAIVQGNVELGANCSVQTGSILIGYGTRDDLAGRISIGRNVRIAPFVQIIAGNHVIADTERPICEQGLQAAPVTIEDDVWVAGRVIITAGVTVGTGAVLAAGAVVTRDVPAWAIAGGVPAKVLRSRKP